MLLRPRFLYFAFGFLLGAVRRACGLASCTVPLASCVVVSAARRFALFCFALSGLLTRCTTSAVPDETVVFIGNCLPSGRVSISNVTSYLWKGEKLPLA